MYGGYGGNGKLYADVEAFDLATRKWAPLSTKGAPAPPRFDHTASLAGTKLIFCGGRNVEAPIVELNLLDIETMTWEVIAAGGDIVFHCVCVSWLASGIAILSFVTFLSTASASVYLLDLTSSFDRRDSFPCILAYSLRHSFRNLA